MDCDVVYALDAAGDAPRIVGASEMQSRLDSLVAGAAWVDAGTLDAGDVLLFTTFTAHRFSQTGGGGAGLRTAEYPSLSCVAMHGAPHQSEAEVLRAVLAGVPPERSSSSCRLPSDEYTLVGERLSSPSMSTAPGRTPLPDHWRQNLIPLQTPLEVAEGQKAEMAACAVVHYEANKGCWTVDRR